MVAKSCTSWDVYWDSYETLQQKDIIMGYNGINMDKPSTNWCRIWQPSTVPGNITVASKSLFGGSAVD